MRLGLDSGLRDVRNLLRSLGYQGLFEENLDPEQAADVKETFTMRNIAAKPPAPREISRKSRACERSSAGRFASIASGWSSYIVVADISMRVTIGLTTAVPNRRASHPRNFTRNDGL